MAAVPASGARGDKVIHQDYIVRQRYSNALPPPHMPPKLLNIPAEGLEYYCSPAFASRMARHEAVNIEADAFLGMPIDLVGMPGIFDGDESCKFMDSSDMCDVKLKKV
jgi:RNA polymerase II-associated factor 1